jgi:hypothetical protein
MSGWVPPRPRPSPTPEVPGPVVGWAAPSDDEGLGVGATIREGWTLTRADLAGLAAVTALPVIAWNALLVPLWLGTAHMFERWITFFSELDWSRYRADPEAFQREVQAVFQPSTEFAVWTAVLGGLGVVVLIVGAAAVTSATLAAAGGHRVSVAASYRAVADHAAALVLPAVILGIAVVVIGLPLSLSQAGIAASGGGPAASAANALLGLLALVVWVAVIVLAIRWSLAFQAILAEDLGFSGGLARSAALTSGVRTRVGLTLVAAGIAVGFVVTIPSFLLALLVGIATASIMAGVVAYTAALIVSSLVTIPLLVAILTVIYRRRAAAVASSPAS